MRLSITGLDPAPFASLFDDDAALAARGGRRVVATASPGFPCRVSLEDARVGEPLVLVPFEHHATDSPYRASGPIFVRRAVRRFDDDRVPAMLRSRLLSVRGYGARGDLIDAEVCPGTALESVLAPMLDDAMVGYVHLHLARPGCFACRVDRG